MSFTGTAQIGNLNFTYGTVAGSGSVAVSGNLNWSGGNLGAVLNLAKTATTLITSSNSSAELLSTGILNNQGTVNLKPPGLGYYFFVAGTINNLSGATWNVQADLVVALRASGAFLNTGSLLKSGGTGTTTWRRQVSVDRLAILLQSFSYLTGRAGSLPAAFV